MFGDSSEVASTKELGQPFIATLKGTVFDLQQLVGRQSSVSWPLSKTQAC